jgi:formate-dependent nitrite reductase membrane component NrfD
MWAGAALAVMSAIYSAFLFKQARGRVFWNSLLTPWHLLAQAIAAGAAFLLLYWAIEAIIRGVNLGGTRLEFLKYELMGGIIAHAVLMAGEVLIPEDHAEKKIAARLITHGIFKWHFWGGAAVAGVLLPLIALAAGFADATWAAASVSALALAGLFLWEHIWVQAGQAVPLS